MNSIMLSESIRKSSENELLSDMELKRNPLSSLKRDRNHRRSLAQARHITNGAVWVRSGDATSPHMRQTARRVGSGAHIELTELSVADSPSNLTIKDQLT
jgi:hypothetical protein